jgi:hypothetical protein
MKAIQVYDKPMCCSTGICGPEIDPILPRFAADLDWLRSQGCSVERFNLAQQPDAFIQNAAVNQLLTVKGTDCLPLIYIDGVLEEQAHYPTRQKFCEWTGLKESLPSLSIVSDSGNCNQPGCC